MIFCTETCNLCHLLVGMLSGARRPVFCLLVFEISSLSLLLSFSSYTKKFDTFEVMLENHWPQSWRGSLILLRNGRWKKGWNCRDGSRKQYTWSPLVDSAVVTLLVRVAATALRIAAPLFISEVSEAGHLGCVRDSDVTSTLASEACKTTGNHWSLRELSQEFLFLGMCMVEAWTRLPFLEWLASLSCEWNN